MAFPQVDESLKGKKVRINNYLDKRGNLYPAGVYPTEALSPEVLSKAQISLVSDEENVDINAGAVTNTETIPETKIPVKTRAIGNKAPKTKPPVKQDLTPEAIKDPVEPIKK